MRLRLLKILLIFLFNYVILWFFSSSSYAALQKPQPLRPFPGKLTDEEKGRSLSDPFLTPYCAQRPTAVQINKIDKRSPTITLIVAGNLQSDLSKFITPLLSVTDPESPHATLSAELKAQGYLTDFLEGRAYYEPKPETEPLNLNEQGLLTRLGVLRKITPSIYQDKLKRLIIQRANNDFKNLELEDLAEEYGFIPASLTVNPKTPVRNTTLKAFYGNWKPLPEDFDTLKEYTSALIAWDQKDRGKWAELWPYVPMFSREDTKGYVQSIPEPGQQGDTIITKPVIHPHLARTYEVSSVLSFMLSPFFTPDYFESPDLISHWNSPPWTAPDELDWWLDSGQSRPQWGDVGPVCDPTDIVVSSSGDPAQEKSINSSVSKTVQIQNPYYQPNSDCETTDPLTGLVDDSNCYVDQPVRFSPTYLKTHTPFLDQIINNLVAGPQALFNNFRLTSQPPEDWPGVGYSTEPSLAYGFSSTDEGFAEAGMKQPGDPAKFFYKGLGYIQCQKEKLLANLQPFLTGRDYTPFSPECPEETPLTPGICDGVLMSQLNPPSQTTSQAKSYFELYILPNLTEEVVSVYAEAEKQTGVPCEVLAGIHFREANNSPDQSLISGRKLGEREPDAKNETFNTLLETAIWAGDHLKSKVPEHGNKITDMKILAKALSRYNGGGNSNCNPQYSCNYAQTATTSTCPFQNCCNRSCRETCAQDHNKTIYDFVYPYPNPPFCPPKFEGDDDPYAIAWYDNNHLDMYLLYCEDHTQCTPQVWITPGTMTVAVEFYSTNKP